MDGRAEQDPGTSWPINPTDHGPRDPYAPPLPPTYSAQLAPPYAAPLPPTYSAPLAPPYGAPAPGTQPGAAWGPPVVTYGPPPLGGPPPPWAVGYPTPYATAPTGPERRTTNTWAIVALVTGALALVPVAVGAAVAALMQIHGHERTGRGQRGKGMAIAGLVGATVWTVAGIVAGIAVAAGGLFSQVGSATSGSLGRVADAGSTSVGSCLRQPSDIDSIATEMPCGEDHLAEVFRVQDLGGTRWPGYDTIDLRADDVCSGAFGTYVGKSSDQSDYDYSYYVPDQSEWAGGEHRVVCVVLPGVNDTLRGSVRNSAR